MKRQRGMKATSHYPICASEELADAPGQRSSHAKRAGPTTNPCGVPLCFNWTRLFDRTAASSTRAVRGVHSRLGCRRLRGFFPFLPCKTDVTTQWCRCGGVIAPWVGNLSIGFEWRCSGRGLSMAEVTNNKQNSMLRIVDLLELGLVY